MDKRIYSCLVITYIIKASLTTSCTIRNDGSCYFTVNCDSPAKISAVPDCDYTDPFITLVINQSPVHNVTAKVFNTKFDSFVRILTAIGNSWYDVQNYAFSNFKNVLYIDLSENHIKTIGKAFSGLGQIDSLNLSRNQLEVIKPEVFMLSENKNRLFLLDLSYNLLTYLSEDFFVHTYNLRKLYLQGNKLAMLGDQHFMSLKNLNYLNLCCSNLRTLNITSKYLTSLRELDLSFNNLKKVDIISEVVSLEAINLSHNNIEEIMFDYFEKFPNLAYLDLSYNKLKEISGFNNPQNANISKPLIKINLNNNKINHIEESFFLVFNKINLLNLSNNEIKVIKKGTFKHVKKLRVLCVSNCGLIITNETFLGLDSTIMIDVSRNNLTTLEAVFFTECKELRRIKADYNKIRALDVKMFIELVPSVKRITLQGNPRTFASLGSQGHLWDPRDEF